MSKSRFSCDLARAARAEEFREGHEQMDRQEEQIAHELKLSCRPICARLHHSGDLCHCQFATHKKHNELSVWLKKIGPLPIKIRASVMGRAQAKAQLAELGSRPRPS